MNTLDRRHFGALALTAVFAGGASGQSNFPSKTVTVTVPVGTGGGTDLVARRVAKALSDQWGQPVVVENKPGASGIIGANVVIKSAPDGHNLLLVWDGPIVATPVLFNRPDYDPFKQLSPISQVSTQGYAVVVHPSVPVKNITELIAHIKKKNADKEPFGFATSSAGAADHLSGETFRTMAGVELLTVNFAGTGPAINNVLGGHIPFGIFSFTAALPHIKAGSLRALAVTSDKRSALLPDVPTVGETLPGYHYHSWIGVFGPAGMPDSLRERISRDIRTAVSSPEVATVLLSNGLVPSPSDPAAFTEFIRQDAVRTAEVIRRAKLKVEQ
jgi:tripartite-type tricarboxylate transporter receptor subunit TctC